jgi:hypothetical protein
MTTSPGHPFVQAFNNLPVTNKREYAERHGYTFYAFDNDIARPRHAFLGSLIAVLSVLRHYDWVFKVDMDTFIMTPDIPLDHFLDPRFDVVASLGKHLVRMRAGVE